MMPEIEQDQNRVINLKAGAHVIMLNVGVFCIFHAPGQKSPNESGLPGVRITRAPDVSSDAVEISTFESDGWMGGLNGAALVRVHKGPSGVMVTTYQDPTHEQEGPRLQVMRLAGDGNEVDALQPDGEKLAPKARDVDIVSRHVVAHVQRHGDVRCAIGDWIGTPGSQAWIEGFSINETDYFKASDVEYQAVLGRGWLSPWVEGGQFCGSRGMSLPILGLRVRLKNEAALRWSFRVYASFTDNTRLGPIEDDGEAIEAESLAPLEAFCLELIPKEDNTMAVGVEDKHEEASAFTTHKVKSRRTRRH